MREASKQTLAFGYVSADGIAQLSNLAGVSTALEATEDEDGRSFIARVLPQVLRGAVKEVFWTAVSTPAGIEDKYAGLDAENGFGDQGNARRRSARRDELHGIFADRRGRRDAL